MGALAALAATGLVAVSASPAAAATAPRQVAYLAASSGLYLYDFASKTSALIDASSAGEVVVAPGGQKAYCAVWGGVAVVDTATNSVTRTISTSYVLGLALTPDGTRLYAAQDGASTVAVIDTATDAVIATVPVGTSPELVSVAPDGRHAYVANYVGDSVSVIDTATNTVSATVTGFSDPLGISFSPDGHTAYVVNSTGPSGTGNGSLAFLNTATNTVTATVPVGLGPEIVATSPDGARLYVANTNGDSVSVLDAASRAVLATVATGSQPQDLDLSSDGSRLYVSTINGAGLSVLDTATNALLAPVATDVHGAGFAALATVTPGATTPTAKLVIPASDDGLQATLNAAGSVRGWGAITSYRFDFGDGTAPVTQSTPTIQHSYPAPGSYPAKVTVTDVLGRTSSATATVVVHVPVATLSLLASNRRYVSVGPGWEVSATATQVTTAEQFIVVDFGDGTVALRNGAYYADVYPQRGNALLVTAPVDAAGRFQLIHNADGTVSLRAIATNTYVSGNDGTGLLTADRTTIGPWEKFSAVSRDNANRSFSANANNRVRERRQCRGQAADRQPHHRRSVGDLRPGEGGRRFRGALLAGQRQVRHRRERRCPVPCVARGTTVGDWEKFTLVSNPDGSHQPPGVRQQPVRDRRERWEQCADRPSHRGRRLGGVLGAHSGAVIQPGPACWSAWRATTLRCGARQVRRTGWRSRRTGAAPGTSRAVPGRRTGRRRTAGPSMWSSTCGVPVTACWSSTTIRTPSGPASPRTR